MSHQRKAREVGIIYEATFRVKTLQSMAVHDETYKLDEFDKQLPALKAKGESMMIYRPVCGHHYGGAQTLSRR
jgi:hypothetical protein